MSCRRPFVALAFLLTICTLSFGQSAEENSADTARQLITDAFAGEKLSDSGRLCFHLSFEGEFGGPVMKREAPIVDRVVYAWAPGGKLRIELMSGDKPVRVIVSDGKAIDTGEKIWDARFAFDYNRHPTDGSQDLDLTLFDEMWVHGHILSDHLTPLSWFNNKRTANEFLAIRTANVTTLDEDGKGATIRLAYTSNPNAYEFIQIGRAGIAYARSNFPAGNMGGIGYERSAPVEVQGVGWVPSRCVVSATSPDKKGESLFRWTSELCPDQPGTPADPALFVIDYTKTPMIPWPYGSRVKNFGYGIVNTVKDLWERVADGKIGD